MSAKLLQPLLFDNGEGAGVLPFIPASEIADFKAKPEPTLYGKAGWIITFKSCEQGRDRFFGAAIDLAAIDEPPPWDIFRELLVRFGKDRRCLVRLAGTMLPPPGTSGGVVSWLWSELITPWMQGTNRADVDLFKAGMRDNPYLPREAIAEMERLYPAGSLDRRIRVDGEWLPGIMGARCYAAFDRRLHVNRALSLDSLDPLKPLLVGLDVNVDPLCGVLVQQHGNVYRVLAEIALRPGTIDGFGQALRRLVPSHRNEVVIYGDAMGGNRTAQTGKTDYDLLAASVDGWGSVRFDIATKNPPDRDRVNVANFLLGTQGRDIRIEIAESCPVLIQDLEGVLWKDDGSGIKKGRNKDDPYYALTHASDALTYLLYAREAGVIRGAVQKPRRRVAIPGPSYSFNAAPVR